MDNQGAAIPALLAPLDESRANNFDFLRFAFATIVVISHCYALTCSGQAAFLRAEPLLRLTHGQLAGGDVAVDGFFLISGFLIANSWLHTRRIADYLRKRVLRIYPGFVTAVLFGLVVVAPLGAWNLQAYVNNQSPRRDVFFIVQLIVPQTLYVFKNWASHDQVNESLWTIRYEFWCYLVVLALGLMRLFRWRWIIVMLSAGAYAIFVLQLFKYLTIPHGHGNDLLGMPAVYPRFLTYFLTGVSFYLYRDIVPRSSALLGGSIVLLVVTGTIGHALDAVMPLCGGYLLFYCAFSKSLHLYNFARYGDLSYGVYLYAFPVQQLVLDKLNRSVSPTLLFLAAYPITILLAELSWHIIEKPFIALKPRSSVDSAVAGSIDIPADKPLH